MVGLHQMHRKQVRFPGNKRSEGWIVPVWGLQTRVQSATICFKQNCFHVRGVDPSDLRMSMKNSPPVNQRAGRFSHFLTVVDPWTMILLPVLCETIRAIGPLVFVRAFWGASFVVKNENKKETPLVTTTQVQTVTKDGTRAQSTWWVEENEVDTITHKKNLMEHFWSNFNTRLIVFSWIHCCQDVNCFGFNFFFLFKT